MSKKKNYHTSKAASPKPTVNTPMKKVAKEAKREVKKAKKAPAKRVPGANKLVQRKPEQKVKITTNDYVGLPPQAPIVSSSRTSDSLSTWIIVGTAIVIAITLMFIF